MAESGRTTPPAVTSAAGCTLSRTRSPRGFSSGTSPAVALDRGMVPITSDSRSRMCGWPPTVTSVHPRPNLE